MISVNYSLCLSGLCTLFAIWTIYPNTIDRDDCREAIEGLGGKVQTDPQNNAIVAAFLVLRADNSDLGSIEHCTSLKKLVLSGASDKSMSHIKKLVNLETLDVSRSDVGDLGIQYLAQLTRIHTLRLRGTRITDRALANLKQMTNLKVLDLEDTGVTDACAKELARLRNVTYLRIANTRFTDRGIIEIVTGMHDLTSLYADKTDITDIGLTSIAGLPSLEYLFVSGTKIRGKSIHELQKSRKLRSVDLGGCKLEIAGYTGLVLLDQVKSLELAESNVTDENMITLQAMGKLRRLSLRKTAITDACLDALVKMRNLEYVDLSQTAISKAGRLKAVTRMPNVDFVFGHDEQ